MPADADLTISVATPAGLFEGTFPKTTKISEVISAIVNALHLAAGDAFQLAFDGNVLQPVERPLVSFGIEDGAQMDLIASGSGV